MQLTNNSWLAVGPAPENVGGTGAAGRPWSIVISPNFDGFGTPAMFLGIAGGGVWRSTTFTSPSPTWIPLTDFLPDMFPLKRKIGLLNNAALAVDPHNPRTIYAGSGDPAGPGPNIYGNGLLKSTDGGKTWTLLGLSPTDNFMPGFTRIFVDPTDNSGNTVYATCGFGVQSPLRGIYKSTDGGASWKLAQGGMTKNLAVLDLDYTVNNNALTLYAGLVDVSGSNSQVNGIWQSTDGGNSWSRMNIQLVDLKSGQPVPLSAVGLINLATDHTPGAPKGMFAAITNGPSLSLMNVFKFTNGTWLPSGNGLSAINTRSAQSIGLSPSGAVYVGGVNDSRQSGLYQTTNGGVSWVSIDVGSNGVRPHTDQHAWAFWGGAVYNGNDGGVWRFTPRANNQAGPGTWESLNSDTLQTILSQGVGVHPNNPDIFLVGSQDNAVALRSTSGVWNDVPIPEESGDNSRVRFDPDPKNNGRYAYTTGQSDFGFFFRSSDGGLTWQDKSVPKSPPDFPHVPDYAPFVFHPIDTSRMLVGLDLVYETRNRGDQWKAISKSLPSPLVSAMAYAGGDTIYVAYQDGTLFKTTNDGGDGSNANWTAVGTNFGGNIVGLSIDPAFPNVVYAGIASGRVWRTTNGASSWEEITGNFPSEIGSSSLALKPASGGMDPQLFVGTQLGVYASSGQGSNTTWKPLGSGLPNVSVTDINYSGSTDLLGAATYGRGIFCWSPRHEWRVVDVTRITGQHISGALTSWQTPDGPFLVEHLAGMAPNGDLLVFYWSPRHDWQVVNVSQITGQKISSSLTSWQTPDGTFNVEHLAGMAPNGDVLVFYWSPRHDWQVVNVSQIAGRQVASSLTSWQTTAGSFIVEHLASIASNGDVLAFSWTPRYDWQVVDVSLATDQHIATPLTSWQTPDGPFNVEHLAGVNSRGNVLVFFQVDWQGTRSYTH